MGDQERDLLEYKASVSSRRSRVLARALERSDSASAVASPSESYSDQESSSSSSPSLTGTSDDDDSSDSEEEDDEENHGRYNNEEREEEETVMPRKPWSSNQNCFRPRVSMLPSPVSSSS